MTRRRGEQTGDRPLLSAADRALWELTARSLQPLPGLKQRVGGVDIKPPQMPHDAPVEVGRSARQTAADRDRSLVAAKPAAKARPAPDLAPFDRKAASRLRRGVNRIEARLDLHGMRQSEAHGALRSFLLGCHGRGLRWVLVITGKGASPSRGPREDGHWIGGREPGVLRRNVPRWLAEPELRAIVVSYEAAALHHGGEGALYIHLRGRRAHPGAG